MQRKDALRTGVSFAVDQFQWFGKELSSLAKCTYTQEDQVDGKRLFDVASEIDHLAELLDQTSFECLGMMEDARTPPENVDTGEHLAQIIDEEVNGPASGYSMAE